MNIVCASVPYLWFGQVSTVVVAALHGIEPAHSVSTKFSTRVAGATKNIYIYTNTYNNLGNLSIKFEVINKTSIEEALTR